MREEVYGVEGMTCAACSAAVERVTRKLPGVEESNVNLMTGTLRIRYDEQQLTPDTIVQKISKAGFTAIPPANPDKEKAAAASEENMKAGDQELKAEGRQVTTALVLAAVLLYVAMGPMLFPDIPLPALFDGNIRPFNYALLQMLLSLPILLIGRRFFTRGLRALFGGNPTMDSLVAIGAGVSFLYSLALTFLVSEDHHLVHQLYYESAGIVVALVMLGKHMEARSKRRTDEAVRKLMQLAPDVALLSNPDGTLQEVPTSQVKVGDLLLIRPGTRIPLDGTVEKGESSADEAMLTGESLPVDKLPGSQVIGGSVNQQGALYVRVTHVGEETTLSRIIRFVQQAQERKAPIAGLADKVAGIFVPAVIAIALLASLAWLIAGKDLSFVVRILTAVLVIACPCAMGLATPTAIVVGTGLGASRGILIRNGEALETTHKAQVVIFDKTGTLTQGRPSLVETVALHGDGEALTGLAALAEEASQHPLAEAFTRRAEELGARPQDLQVTQFENITGRGIRVTFSDGRKLALGNAAFMQDIGIDPAPLAGQADSFAGLGHTVIFAALNDTLTGLFSVADQVKPNAAQAVQELKDMGIRTVLLTGDTEAAARAIGSQVGVDEVIARVLPEEKAAVVERFRQQGHTVLMVGDGINDSPALAAADVGCAIGNGSDIAIEAADLVLMKSDVEDVPRAIRLSRLTIRNIKQNLFWAFFYNTIGIPVAAGLLYLFGGPLMNPMLAGLAMSLSSVFVVGNALRLRRARL